MSLHHGGALHAAAQRFGVPLEQWLDLSTGVSPYSWPVPDVPQSVWRDLPDADDALERAAASYYGCAVANVLPVPGSQYALATLPSLLAPGRVAMPLRGYAEHRAAWARAQHELINYRSFAELVSLVQGGELDHALVINPNNPTAQLLQPRQLLALRDELHVAGGLLIVDEAFGDIEPDHCLATELGDDGLVVYRSIGKFFGLAGLRLGFLLAQPGLCRAMAANAMPWQVSHPARWLGQRALLDHAWQQAQRARLRTEGRQWRQELQALLPQFELSGAGLFVTASASGQRCADLFEFAGQQGLLLRLFEEQQGRQLLRFGLPAPGDKSRAIDILQSYAGESRCSEAC